MASPVTRSTHTDFLAAVIREITVPPATIAAADLAGLLVDLGSSVTELSVIALPEKRRFHARYAMAFAACCAARAYWLAREIEARAAADAADAPGASL